MVVFVAPAGSPPTCHGTHEHGPLLKETSHPAPPPPALNLGAFCQGMLGLTHFSPTNLGLAAEQKGNRVNVGGISGFSLWAKETCETGECDDGQLSMVQMRARQTESESEFESGTSEGECLFFRDYGTESNTKTGGSLQKLFF